MEMGKCPPFVRLDHNMHIGYIPLFIVLSLFFLYPVMHFRLDTSVFQCITAMLVTEISKLLGSFRKRTIHAINVIKCYNRV